MKSTIRTVFLPALAALLVLFQDQALTLVLDGGHFLWEAVAWVGEWVLEGLHLLLETLELLCEHALEKLFGLSVRAAQVATAWLGLALVLGLAPFLVHWGRAGWRAARARALARWREGRRAGERWLTAVRARPRWAMVVLAAAFSWFLVSLFS
ncbi:hypothetical protein [Candidatus Methylocalor cossyra]|uniref:Uncharacterized protein n=1 Tax=Candidatus Methylocalor cossyra TaxID=3108543 RepID=A0ABM9NGF0_9GAMM